VCRPGAARYAGGYTGAPRGQLRNGRPARDTSRRGGACYRDGVLERREEPAESAADDAELARRIAAGRPGESGAAGEAEAELARRFAPRIRLFGLRRLRDPAAAQDLVQEVLVTTLEALRAGRVHEPERLASFILGTCRMTVANQRRGAQRQARLLAQFARDLEPEPDRPGGATLDRDRLAHCLAELPARDRTVVALTFYAESSAEAIAAELETSAGHVRVLRHRALARLHDCLEGLP
jgi:RNA polymerase sigma-70 factor, ECF subfamily